MDDEQERHEQVMYRLDAIEKDILRLDSRSIETANDTKRIRHLVEDIERILVSLVFLAPVSGCAFYITYRWLGTEITNWILLSIAGVYIGFLILRSWWRSFRMRYRVQMAAPDAFEFKVGDRVSVWRSDDDRYGLPAGSKGTVVENDRGIVEVQWDNGVFGSYLDPDIHNLDKIGARSGGKRASAFSGGDLADH